MKWPNYRLGNMLSFQIIATSDVFFDFEDLPYLNNFEILL